MNTRKLETKGWCYISCQVKHVTRMAMMINDGARDAWLPRSLIEDPDPATVQAGEYIELLIPEWLATEKGLL